jgi:hypothetical protein
MSAFASGLSAENCEGSVVSERGTIGEDTGLLCQNASHTAKKRPPDKTSSKLFLEICFLTHFAFVMPLRSVKAYQKRDRPGLTLLSVIVLILIIPIISGQGTLS